MPVAEAHPLPPAPSGVFLLQQPELRQSLCELWIEPNPEIRGRCLPAKECHRPPARQRALGGDRTGSSRQPGHLSGRRLPLRCPAPSAAKPTSSHSHPQAPSSLVCAGATLRRPGDRPGWGGLVTSSRGQLPPGRHFPGRLTDSGPGGIGSPRRRCGHRGSELPPSFPPPPRAAKLRAEPTSVLQRRHGFQMIPCLLLCFVWFSHSVEGGAATKWGVGVRW